MLYFLMSISERSTVGKEGKRYELIIRHFRILYYLITYLGPLPLSEMSYIIIKNLVSLSFGTFLVSDLLLT